MIEKDVIHTSPVSKRIFDIIQDVFDFIVLLVRMMLGIFQSIVELFLPKNLKDVSGEIVLITGTGHGIGRELALHYTTQHSTVICVDINEKGNEETVLKAKRLNKGVVHAYTCDVSNRESILKLAEQIKRDIGPVSILINNVGIMPTKPLDKQTSEDIRRVFEINVYTQFWTLEAFLPHMKEQNRGHIVAMSSIAGIVGLTNLIPYCATKFAIRGLMEALHEEIRQSPYKDLIKTTTICPYMTNTGLCKHPKVKFPSLLGLLDPKDVAAEIVKAQRSGTIETTIPSSLLHINNWCRLLPSQCAQLLKDYIGSGVDAD